MFADYAKIFIKSGKGGDGHVSFRRELFGGDEERMNKAINELNELHSYEDSISYLNNELKWNIEDNAVTDFIKLLEKRFL